MTSIPLTEPVFDRLLHVAIEVFAERGFRATTVRDICSRANVNVASVNYYFRSKEALYRQGQARRVPICPVSTPADVAASRQLDYRGFFTSVPHRASGQAVRMPGAPFQMSATPWRIARSAPQLGQHTGAVLGELGIGAEELQKLKRAGVV